jgi:hypothetical protein
MDITEITQFLESSYLSDFLLPWKILAVIVSALFIYAIIYYFLKQEVILQDAKRRTKDFLSFQRFAPSRAYFNRAQEVFGLLKRFEYKKAVLRSEGIFYDLLRQFGYSGKNLAEVVNGTQSDSIPNADDLKKLAVAAEEIRKNKNYVADPEKMKDIFDSFEDTLRKMDVIVDEDD